MNTDSDFIDSDKKAANYLGTDLERLEKAKQILSLGNSGRYYKKDLDMLAAQIHKKAEALRRRRIWFRADLDLLSGGSEPSPDIY